MDFYALVFWFNLTLYFDLVYCHISLSLVYCHLRLSSLFFFFFSVLGLIFLYLFIFGVLFPLGYVSLFKDQD